MDSRELPQYLEAVREALTLWKQMEKYFETDSNQPVGRNPQKGSVGSLVVFPRKSRITEKETRCI